MEPQAPVQQAAPNYSYNAPNYGAPYNSVQPRTAQRTLAKPTLIFMIISMVSTFLAAVLPLIPLYNTYQSGISSYGPDKKYYNIITNFTRFFTKEYEHSQSFYSSVLQFVFLIMAFCLVVAGIILFFLKFKASPAVFLAASVIMVGEIYAYFFSWWSELLFMADRGSTGYESTMTIVPFFAIEWLGRHQEFPLERMQMPRVPRWIIYWALLAGIALASLDYSTQFIYFQF